MVRLARRLFRTSEVYDGDKLFTVVGGRRVMTPMLLVMVAIGSTDILFALDSIPAIFGLTQNVFVVFTATAFSLLGLRQLYFLLGGLLDRLVYLSFGLAAVLAFIGVKLSLHALHENNVPFINGGEAVAVVEISTGASLVIIVAVLVITVIASLTSAKGRAVNLVTAARRHATEYLMCETDPAVREDIFQKLLAEEWGARSQPEFVIMPGRGDGRWLIDRDHQLLIAGSEEPERGVIPCRSANSRMIPANMSWTMVAGSDSGCWSDVQMDIVRRTSGSTSRRSANRSGSGSVRATERGSTVEPIPVCTARASVRVDSTSPITSASWLTVSSAASTARRSECGLLGSRSGTAPRSATAMPSSEGSGVAGPTSTSGSSSTGSNATPRIGPAP
jgi:hypothetical protein